MLSFANNFQRIKQSCICNRTQFFCILTALHARRYFSTQLYPFLLHKTRCIHLHLICIFLSFFLLEKLTEQIESFMLSQNSFSSREELTHTYAAKFYALLAVTKSNDADQFGMKLFKSTCFSGEKTLRFLCLILR